ncbi:MAG TPA: trimethylamine methyltransferase family protein, partial [Aestuariivirga sp.]|nr:trimethylamine methyltransferase family protein [Aestuariivirga sp.]
EALATYQKPAIDPATEEQLAAFVAKRKEQGGAPIE